MRLRRLSLYACALLWTAIGIGATFAISQNTGTGMLDFAYPVLLSENGSASQHDSIVASAHTDERVSSLRLTAPSSTSYQAISITLPYPVIAVPPISFRSIQGTSEMQAQLLGNQTVLVSLPPILEGSASGFTLSFPANYFHPTPALRIQDYISLIPIVTWIKIGALLSILTLLSVYARQPHFHTTIGLNPEQRNIPAPIVALLLENGVRAQSLIASIFELADQKALELFVDQGRLFFIRHDVNPLDLQPHERSLLDLLAPDNRPISSQTDVLKKLARNIFSPEVSSYYEAMYDELIPTGWFQEDPRQSHLRIKTVGILMQLAALIALIWMYFLSSSSLVALDVFLYIQYLLGFLLYRLSGRHAYYTASGHEALAACQLFRKELSSRVPETPGTNFEPRFYRYLPYAAAAGVADAWSARFTRQSFFIPPWLSFSDHELIDPQQLATSLSRIARMIGSDLSKFKDPNVD